MITAQCIVMVQTQNRFRILGLDGLHMVRDDIVGQRHCYCLHSAEYVLRSILLHFRFGSLTVELFRRSSSIPKFNGFYAANRAATLVELFLFHSSLCYGQKHFVFHPSAHFYSVSHYSASRL